MIINIKISLNSYYFNFVFYLYETEKKTIYYNILTTTN